MKLYNVFINDKIEISPTEKRSVPFLKIAPIVYICNLLKNLFNFALVRFK